MEIRRRSPGSIPQRLSLHATGMSRFLPSTRTPRSDRRRRSIFAVWPDERWAQEVFPNVKSATAQRRLARDLLDFCRVGPHDPPGALRAHLDGLHERADRLTRLALDRVDIGALEPS